MVFLCRIAVYFGEAARSQPQKNASAAGPGKDSGIINTMEGYYDY